MLLVLHRFSCREGGAGGAGGADRLASRGETPPAAAVAPLSETLTAAVAPLSVMWSIEEGEGLGPWVRAAVAPAITPLVGLRRGRRSEGGEQSSSPMVSWCQALTVAVGERRWAVSGEEGAEPGPRWVEIPLSFCSVGVLKV